MLDISTKYCVLTFSPKLKLSKDINIICCLRISREMYKVNRESTLYDTEGGVLDQGAK
jgi:hypothetical protein